MSRKLITPPAAEPILLADAKLHMKAPASATEDSLVNLFIATGREEVENELRRALITQTWEKYLDRFPEGIELFNPPLVSVTSVSYVDPAGNSQVLATTEYVVDDKQEPAWIVPAYGKIWPSTLDTINAVTVRFVCGYGAAGTDVPKAIRSWMLLRIANLFKNRESVVMESGAVNVASLPATFVDRLLDRYRISPPL